MIEQALDETRRAWGESQAAGDREALATAGRNVRYWSARRASAVVMPMPASVDIVHFGHTVTIVRDEGREPTFRIVGGDEADPAQGSISHASPLVRALLGKRVGDVIQARRGEAEIARIR